MEKMSAQYDHPPKGYLTKWKKERIELKNSRSKEQLIDGFVKCCGHNLTVDLDSQTLDQTFQVIGKRDEPISSRHYETKLIMPSKKEFPLKCREEIFQTDNPHINIKIITTPDYPVFDEKGEEVVSYFTQQRILFEIEGDGIDWEKISDE